MTTFSTLLGEQKLLPIIQADTPEDGVNIAKAMHEAGITLVEVVLRTENSLLALSAIKSALPDLIVGAGTVINEELLSKSLYAGADFIVTPAISRSLLSHLTKCPVPVLPGVSNTADILLALEHGFTEQKLFPALIEAPQKTVTELIQELNLAQTGDDDTLKNLIAEVLDENAAKVDEYKSGKTGLLGMFMGQIMKKSGGKADPKKTNQLLREALNN